MKPSAVLSSEQQNRVVDAIRETEKQTSAEIRVHMESFCPGDVLDRSVEVFAELGMEITEARNGVLIYIALKDHKSAIIGDINVNKYVEYDFWNRCHELMAAEFAKGNFCEGIVQAIECLREELKTHFPYHSDDSNELPDEISFGE